MVRTKVCLFVLPFLITLIFPASGLAQIDTTSLFPLKFTDFTQAANEDPTLGAIHWIGSILQESNSRYYEGMSVCQRLIFNDVPSTPGDTHALTMSIDATKGGIHAYDFLTSWDNAIPAADSIAPGYDLLIDLFADQCDPEFWGSTQLICDHIHSLGLYDEADLTVLDMGSVAGDNVQLRAENYDTYFGISRTVKIWGDQAVSSASITFDGYTGSTDDKAANYTLYWTSASDTVIIEMAGHLAAGVDPLNAGIGYGEGRGAANISGGPYHFKLSYLDDKSLGSQDNQIKGADVIFPSVKCDVTPGSDAVCVGFDATFTDRSSGGTTPYSWVWTKPPDNTVLSTDSTLTISDATQADSGQYRVIVTDDGGLADTCYAYLTVHPQPVCSITGDSVVCEGFTTAFCATPGMASYSWSGPGGFSTNTQCTGQIGTAGYYQVIITDANGCADTCGRTLVVDLRPEVTAPDTVEFELCDTATVCFDITLYDLDELDIVVNPPGQFNPSDSSICFFADRDTTYPFAIIATDTCGNSDTSYAVAVVHFNEPPDVNSPDTVEYFLEAPSTCCFDITLGDLDDPLNVTVSPPGQYNPSDSTICFFADRDTTYHFIIIATDQCGTTPAPIGGVGMSSGSTLLADTSYTVAIVKFNNPPVITAPDTVEFYICDTATVCFDITLYDPDDGLNVSVNPPGQYNPSDSSICFFADRDTTYNFTIIASDSSGGSDTAYTVAIVHYDDPPWVTSPDTVTYDLCEPDTVCFKIIISDPDDHLTVDISLPGWFDTCQYAQGVCFWAYKDTTYHFVIVVTDTCGRADTTYTTAIVNMNDPPVVTAPDTLKYDLCDTATVCFDITLYDPDDGLNVTVNPPGQYNPSDSSICFFADRDTTYDFTIIVTDTCGAADTAYTTVVIGVTLPQLTCSGDTLTCDSTLASAKVISDPSDEVSYLWTPAPVSGQGTAHARYDSPGTKKVVVTIDATGCKDSCEAVIVEEATKPQLTCSGDTLTCDSTLASAKVISDPSDEVSYLWTPAPVSGQGTAHARYNSPGTKKVVVTIDATGCKDSCEAIIIEEATKPQLTCSGDTLTCDSTLASAKVTSDPSSGVSYFWTPEPVSGQGTAHARYDEPGMKKVVVTIDSTGCKDSCEAYIHQDIDLPDLICSGDTLTCDSTLASAKVISDPSDEVSYFWTPAPVSGQGTAHARYDSPGTKKVVVTIDSTGCKDSCEAYIHQDIDLPDLICSGDTLTCDSTLASAKVISDPSTGVSYFWTPAPVSGQGTAHARYNSPGTKKVVVTIDATGCKDSCLVVIAESTTPPECIITGNSVICEGTTTELCATPDMVSYSWSGPEGFTANTRCTGQISTPGYYRVFIEDANGCTNTCSTRLEVIPCECLINVWIDSLDCVFPGNTVEIPVNLATDRPIGGFKLYIEYDPTVMNFLGIQRGDMIDEFDGYYDDYNHVPIYDFQYFNHRMLPCAQQCETYKIKVVGIADMPDGVINGPLEAGQGELMKLRFQVSKDANLQDLFLPVKFEFDYDFDLKAPSFSDPTGETLYVDEAWPGETSQPNDDILRIICFYDGGVKVCSDAFCWAGDINLNEYPYEISDAVMFANYFLFGPGVFDIDYNLQILATDVNQDGFTLSMSDFVFLIRIILEDISPKHKLSPSSDLAAVNVVTQGDAVKVVSSSNTSIGAALYVFRHAGEIKNLIPLTDMNVKYHDANGELRVLVYNFEGRSIPAGAVDLFSFEAKEVELVEVNATDFFYLPSLP